MYMMRFTAAIALCAFLLASHAIAQQRVLLAAEDDWYPYAARIDQTAQGRSVDIVKAAYGAMGSNLTLEVVPFKRGLVLTKDGTYAGVFNAGINEDIRRDYLIPRFSLAVSEQIAVGRKGEPFAGKSSFNGKRLVLTNGYTYPNDITEDPKNKVSRATTEIGSLKMVAANRADFTIIDRLVFMSLLAKEPSLKRNLEIGGVLHTEQIYVVFAKSPQGEKARELFDQGMDIITRNGSLKRILDDWEARLR